MDRSLHTSVLDSSTQGLEGLLLGWGRGSPGQTHEPEADRPHFFVEDCRHLVEVLLLV